MFGRKTEAQALQIEPPRQEPLRQEPRLRGMARPSMAAPAPQAGLGRPPVALAVPRRLQPVAAEPLPPAEADPGRLVIDRGITLTGEIRACDQLVVEGRVEASLARASRVEVTACGRFKGSAVVDDAEIAGQFEGELTVRRQLVVRRGGQVAGRVRCGALEVERGGMLSGHVEKVAEVAGERDGAAGS